jgi:threonine/homoserine/homoserine lactone efflux protein
MLEALGLMLPATAAVALSPFPIIGIVLMLAGPSGRRNGPLFAAGWIVGLTLVIAAALLLVGSGGDADGSSRPAFDWLRVVAGVGLIILGLRKVFRHRRDEAHTPAWMSSLDDATAGRAAMLGVLLSLANPKVLILSVAAAVSITEIGVEGGELVIAGALFVVLGSSTVLAALVIRSVGGERGAFVLDGVRAFVVAHTTAITVVILLLIGVNVLGNGLAGLGS